MPKSIKIIFATLSLGTLLLTGCLGTSLTEEGRPFDTAIINYKWTGAIEGKETLYIDGNKTRSEINTSTIINGVKSTQNRVIINDGEYIYKIDQDTDIALKEENPYAVALKSLKPEDKQEFRKRLILLLNEGEKMPDPEGEEIILAKPCKVYTVTLPSSTCIWEGLILRNEIAIDQGKAKQKAVSMEKGVKIPESFFAAPEGIKIQEIK